MATYDDDMNRLNELIADVRAEWKPELLAMNSMDDEELWTIIRSVMTNEELMRMSNLGYAHDERGLSEDETQELDDLRHKYGWTLLRQARAYAILSVRTGTPLLANTQKSLQ